MISMEIWIIYREIEGTIAQLFVYAVKYDFSCISWILATIKSVSWILINFNARRAQQRAPNAYGLRL